MGPESAWIAAWGVPSAAAAVVRALAAVPSHPRRVSGVAVLSPDPDPALRARRAPGPTPMPEGAAAALPGAVAVGAAWWAPAGSAGEDVVAGLCDPSPRPIAARAADGWWVGAVTGALANHGELLQTIGAASALPEASADALLVALVARSAQRTAVNRAVDALVHLRGVFGAALAHTDLLLVARDAHGVHALYVGALEGGVLAGTDRAALWAAGARDVRLLDPGEVVVVDASGEASVRPFGRKVHAPCTLESLSFGAPGASPAGEALFSVRAKLGARLGTQHPVSRADGVIALASAPVAAAFAAAIGAPCVSVGADGEVWRDAVAGRRLVILADTLAGSALPAQVRALYEAGASEVHVRALTSGPTQPCRYGVALPEPLADAGGASWAALGVTSVASLDPVAVRDGVRARAWRAEPCEGCLGGATPVRMDVADEQLGLFVP